MTIVTPDQFTAPRRDEKPAAWCDFGRDRQMAVTHAVLRRDNTRAVAIFSSETDLACSLDHGGKLYKSARQFQLEHKKSFFTTGGGVG